MHNLVKFAFAGIASAAIAGTAVAASADKHMLEVALPGGVTAHIEYYGDVAPKVTIVPGTFAPFAVGWAPAVFPDFGAIMQRMDAERAAMMKQVRQMTSRGAGGGVAPINVASYANMPAGTNSVSVVSISNGSGTCTRTTRIIAQGAGKAPKVVSDVSGTCGSEPGAAGSAAPPPAGSIDRT